MKITIPIPSRDFDPTEVAVSWKILRDAGHEVEFATPDGKRGHADPLMLTGEGLDVWGCIPGLRRLRLIGLVLRADRAARSDHAALERDDRFLSPRRYQDLSVDAYDALLLPGGHAKGMRAYLEDRTLQRFVAAFFDSGKPVAAICHGVLLAARSISAQTGKSALHGRKTTGLTWDQERTAWHLTKYFARFWDPDYYRTYGESGSEPPGHWSVEMEVKRALASPSDFLDVPKNARDRFLKTSGLARDRLSDSRPAWVVRDGNYVSARWPGDAHGFAQAFLRVLEEERTAGQKAAAAADAGDARLKSRIESPSTSF